ncbi:MAG: hypothetical protein C0429_09610 [Sphingopyxis sp.]|nr:hypothetical protein [Sphingopyxis sp.]
MVPIGPYEVLFILVWVIANGGSAFTLASIGVKSRNLFVLLIGIIGGAGTLKGFLIFLTETDRQAQVMNETSVIWLLCYLLVGSVSLVVAVILWWNGAFRFVEPPKTVAPPPPPPPAPKLEPVPPPPVTFPDDLRTEHAVIVAQSGHGKTQLLQSLILDDLEKDRTVIVLDSQSQLIKNLINVVPVNRLVYLSPTNDEAPLALNLFDYGQDASLFEYMFASLDAEMTSKQSTLYRYLARLVSVIPNANLETMRQILEPKGVEAFREHIAKLPPLAKAFFDTEFSSTEYRETRQQLARRLYTLLENDAFRQMFTATKMKLFLPREMNDGKVILINATKRTLKGDAFKVFGRFFISQIARAIFDREHPYQKRVSIYIDEFQEYAGDEEFIAELFTQARKFNVALTVAFQHLDMLPDAVRSAILTNTSIKVAGSLSAPDRRIFASEMGLRAEDLLNLKKGQFMALFKGQRPQHMNVEFGRLEAMGTRSRSELRAIEKRMADLYGEEPVVVDPEPTTPKLNFEDFKDRE